MHIIYLWVVVMPVSELPNALCQQRGLNKVRIHLQGEHPVLAVTQMQKCDMRVISLSVNYTVAFLVAAASTLSPSCSQTARVSIDLGEPSFRIQPES